MKANALGLARVMFLWIASGCGQSALKHHQADASVLGGTVAVGGVPGAGGLTSFGGNAGSGGRTGTGGSPAGAGGVGGTGQGGRDGGVDAPAIESGGGGTNGTGGTTGLDAGQLGCSGKFELSGLLPFLHIAGQANLVAAGDLNGDGKPDIVATSLNNSSVTVLLAKGNGRFAPGQEYAAAGGRPDALALVDVNGDGKLDIVTGQDSSASVLLGNGDGTFAVKVDSPAGSTAAGMVFDDLDGDGRLDLVTVSSKSADSVSVLLGKGDGTFGSAVDYKAGSSNTKKVAERVALGDLNGDHKSDIVVLGRDSFFGTITVNVLLGKGDGTFAAEQELTCAGIAPTQMALGDFNGDGTLDIATSDPYSYFYGSICVLPGKGDGTFGDPVKSSSRGELVAAKDMNGDGKLDIVTETVVMLGKGDGTFVEGATFLGPYYVRSLAIADMNGDGRPDVAIAMDDLSVQVQAADGTFDPGLPQYPAGAGATSVALGDLNGDGRLDVVTANTASVSVLLGKGGGNFAGKVDYAVGGRPAVLLLGDVNGDGKPDIVTDVPGGVLLAKGDGTFTAKSDDGTGIGGTSMALGDLNGDGRLDVVTVTYVRYTNSRGAVSVRLGNGDGSFAAATGYPVGVDPDSVALGDVNGDDKLDIVVANQGADGYQSISLLLGQGDGTLGTAQRLDTEYGPRWIALADLNGDGKLDIFTIEEAASTSVHMGNGDGTFAPRLSSTFDDGYLVALADVDGDGKLDLVAAARNTIEVQFGRGDGNPGLKIYNAVGTAGFALGDLDGDGLLDIVATKPGADSVFTILASCP
jgi:hypothetical protein